MATARSSPGSEATIAQAVRTGLSRGEAHRRLVEFGPNQIQREPATSPLIVFARQFASPVIGLLVGASVIALALGEYLDVVAIGVILFINATIGFLQEHR